MSVTAYKAATAEGQIASEWTNPQNALIDNGAYAQGFGSFSPLDEQDYYTFGFTTGDIPSGATIDGIEVSVKALSQSAGATIRLDLDLVKGGVKHGSTYSQSWTYAGGVSTQVYGGAADKWGGTWLDTNIAGSSTFGVYGICVMTAGSGYPTLGVDIIKIRVYYTVPAEGRVVATQIELTHTEVTALLSSVHLELTHSEQTVRLTAAQVELTHSEQTALVAASHAILTHSVTGTSLGDPGVRLMAVQAELTTAHTHELRFDPVLPYEYEWDAEVEAVIEFDESEIREFEETGAPGQGGKNPGLPYEEP